MTLNNEISPNSQSRSFVFIGGLCGASGVGLSAIAAHRQELVNLGIAANMLLFHAPAFLAISLLINRKLARLGGWALALGLALFVGDLLVRAYLGTRLFPLAAPIGGSLLIAGWTAVALSGLAKTRH